MSRLTTSRLFIIIYCVSQHKSNKHNRRRGTNIISNFLYIIILYDVQSGNEGGDRLTILMIGSLLCTEWCILYYCYLIILYNNMQ